MTFASEMADMANELLAEFGSPRTMVLTRETPTGTESAPGIPIRKDYDVIGVVKLKYLDTVEGGTLIDANRRELVLSTKMVNGKTLPINPASGDKATFDDYSWTVDSAAPVSPGGEAIVHKLELVK